MKKKCFRCGDICPEENCGIVEFRDCSGRNPVWIQLCKQCAYIMLKRRHPRDAYEQAIEINKRVVEAINNGNE